MSSLNDLFWFQTSMHILRLLTRIDYEYRIVVLDECSLFQLIFAVWKSFEFSFIIKYSLPYSSDEIVMTELKLLNTIIKSPTRWWFSMKIHIGTIFKSLINKTITLTFSKTPRLLQDIFSMSKWAANWVALIMRPYRFAPE